MSGARVPFSSRRIAALVGALALTAALLAAARPWVAGLIDGAGLAPAEHPDVVLDRAVQAEFGMLRPIVWVVAARHGTVWNPEVLATLQSLTRDAFKIPGVVGTEVISLASPNLRELQITDSGLRPVYLMPAVPRTAEELAALRARVESDPNYAGTLVSRDGRAAMVVAELQPDADGAATAAAMRELRERHTNDDALVFAAGAPLMATSALRPAVVIVAAALGLGLLAALVALGWTGLARSLFAAGLAVLWSGSALIVAQLAVLPWSAMPLCGALLIAAAAALAPVDRRTAVVLGIAIAAAGFPLALLATSAHAFGVATALGGVLALVAGALARAVVGAPRHDIAAPTVPVPRRWQRTAARAAAVLLGLGGVLGLAHLHTAFGIAGYGQRYLVGREGADLRAIIRHFPPPSALAVRVRGADRFVNSPAVLGAFDAWEQAARADPAVERAMSLADIVKMVHQGFNDGDAAFYAIPDDSGLLGRYLTLAYSPGFRRFVDRSLSTAAVWVYVRGDSAADLGRVRDRLAAAIAAAPLPDAHIDQFAGDGAVVLAMASVARQLALGALIGIALFAAVVAALVSPRAAAWSLLAALGGALVGAGALGWSGIPIDLLTLPLLLAGTTAAAVLAALGVLAPSAALPRLGILLAAAGLTALACPHAAVAALGAWLLPPGLAALMPLLRGES